MREGPYSIRAHHGMCLAYFQGKGYSREFVENMRRLQEEFAGNPPVRIGSRADEICCACPNNRGGICKDEDKVAGYDRQVMQMCDLAEGEVMPFQEFAQLVRENVLLSGKREDICGNCQWSAICK